MFAYGRQSSMVVLRSPVHDVRPRLHIQHFLESLLLDLRSLGLIHLIEFRVGTQSYHRTCTLVCVPIACLTCSTLDRISSLVCFSFFWAVSRTVT